ncbi:hypothetical protein A2Z00_02440 [Candidatus Gottesmanbacteria bacterium RBG_13_45_10]|uniref:Glycosyltransferase 2-like domain-containing protein n=1 Tax=Candidatus Gottesmanbacteria bacterium RBG_13_45_10 TaxID=1798370 RepID=A0A1F5ZGQ2_9BACT|nr:MAG: hypothetical protein A2Z00_02440 [Candidatus Gottesmanbacteria bacterium RBG_13_45_10]
MTTAILPKVSFIILTYNDAAGLERCLKSIIRQDYPKRKIEVIVVDDGSEDETVQIAKSYRARVLMNGMHDMYRSWALGLHAVRGDFTYLLEQDIELRDKSFLRQMTRPLLNDRSIAGSFTRKYPRKDQSWTTQFISYHPAQADPLYEFFSPPVERTIIEKKENYFICDYASGKIPPFGRMMYRMKFLRTIPIWHNNKFYDFETLLAMIGSGYTRYAYVPAAGIYHHHAKNLSHLLAKRVRNLKNHYIQTNSPYKYTWFDTGSLSGLLKIFIWVLYANLIFPATIRGIIRACKYRNAVLLMEPIVTITTTDVILYHVLADPLSRKFFLEKLGKTLRGYFRLREKV